MKTKTNVLLFFRHMVKIIEGIKERRHVHVRIQQEYHITMVTMEIAYPTISHDLG